MAISDVARIDAIADASKMDDYRRRTVIENRGMSKLIQTR